MLSYVKKCRERISYILVYSLERFSRNDHSIWLSNQLRALGIEIVSVTQPIDTSNPSGKMQQKMLFLFGEFDNELRKQKCMAGMKEMLLQGNWPTKPPLGYDSLILNGKRTIVINAKGKVLRQAFQWKADEGLTHDAIRERLARNGIVLCRQRITAILRNPFYCGLIAHNMLDGAVVPGKHEPIITKELFLKVNGVLDQFTHGYAVKEENDHIPLKRFLRCGKCNQFLRGYIVKKKNIHYYKCCTIGCGTNRSAKTLNERFAEVLHLFTLNFKPDVLTLIKTQAIATFNQYTKEHQDGHAVLEEQYKELRKKIERLEERFIEEEITGELYYKYLAKFSEEKEAIEQQLLKTSKKVSNLGECIQMAIDFACNMPKKWLSADYYTKQRLQFLLFPEGITYSRETDQCRTPRVNSVFLYLAHLKQIMNENKKGAVDLTTPFFNLSRWVDGAGLEPLCINMLKNVMPDWSRIS